MFLVGTQEHIILKISVPTSMACEQISTVVKMLMYLLLHSLRCNMGITGLSHVSAISSPIGR